MPEGQYTGQKASYIYTSDNGSRFALYRDTDLVFGELTDLDPYTEGAPSAFTLPRGFKPRGVYWLGYIGSRPVRKFLICGSQGATLYASDESLPLTIDGVEGFTVSRIGERQRLVRRTRSVPVVPAP